MGCGQVYPRKCEQGMYYGSSGRHTSKRHSLATPRFALDAENPSHFVLSVSLPRVAGGHRLSVIKQAARSRR